MKIAIATSDGKSVCEHLARSSAFIVFDIEAGKAAGRTVRDRASEACGNHRTFVEMLEGCDAVVCGGIGGGAWDSLTAHGIRPVVAAGTHGVEEALELYLAGKLATTNERVCLCGPAHSH